MGSLVWTTAAWPARLNRQICFESYPTISWFGTETYLWPIEEATTHLYADLFYQLIILHQFVDSNGYLNFEFIGHGKDRIGDEAAVKGAGFKIRNHWHFEYSAGLVQGAVIPGPLNDAPAPPQNYPSYQLNSVWDFYDDSFKDGIGYVFNDVANSQAISNAPDDSHNDFSVMKVNQINCKDFLIKSGRP